MRESVEITSSQKKNENVYPGLANTDKIISIENATNAIIVKTSNPKSA
jgi:hypothetical protein